MRPRLTVPENPPIAERITTHCSAHGKRWVDHYAWLKAENWQEVVKDPAKLPAAQAAYLKAENDYHDLAMAELAPLQKELYAEMRGRMEEDVDSLPAIDGPYKYFYRRVKDAEYVVRVRTDLYGDNEEIVFDANVEARGFEYFDLGYSSHSPDHTKLLWSCDKTGSDFFTLHIRDIETGLDANYTIDNMDSVAWGDNQTVFYTRLNDVGRPTQVYRHTLGTSPDTDVLVFDELDDRFSCAVELSLSRDYVIIGTWMDGQDECWVIPTNDINAKPSVVQPRTEGLEYDIVGHQGDRFIIITNADDSVDQKLIETPVNATSMEHWTDLISYQSGRMIARVVVFKDWIIWEEIVNALPQIAYRDNNGVVERIKFDEEAYTALIFSQLNYFSNVLVFEYSSPTTPTETYDFKLQTGERDLVKTQIIPSGHDPENYVTRRISVASHDGAQVPVTLLYRHDTPIDGTAPVFLAGYGANGDSILARFGSTRFSLVDRGFVYAIAHVRGGMDKGHDWYEQAKLDRKTNSFLDFIAVGEALLSQGYAAADKIVSYGSSSGGLLVAASMHMKPELFAAVIAEVPFVDVLNRLLDESLPGAQVKWSQWGNPIEDKAAFEWIQQYSPYENTQATAYPSLYVTAGVSDLYVTYWEPAKWVAKIRAMKTDSRVVLLRTNMHSGHFGSTGRFAGLEEDARIYAFAISEVGRNE